MFGLFKKKPIIEEDEEVVDFSDVHMMTAEEKTAKDAAQDAYIREMEVRIAKLSSTIKEMKRVDEQISKSDADQSAQLKELTLKSTNMQNTIDSFSVRCEITVKNCKAIKSKLARIDKSKLDGQEQRAIEESISLLDNIIGRFK